MKELMDKATTAYAEGNYIEGEAFAKRAMEVDPNELAASMLVFKAKTERHYKQDLQNKNDKEEGVVTASRKSTWRPSPTRKSSSGTSSIPKNFKDLTRDRLAMNARLEPRKDPKVLAIEAKLKDRISINMDKQPLSEADHVPPELHGLEHRARPQGAGRRGFDLGVAREPGRQQDPAQDRPEADAPAARADLQGRG